MWLLMVWVDNERVLVAWAGYYVPLVLKAPSTYILLTLASDTIMYQMLPEGPISDAARFEKTF